jgi:hypothetical protein
MIDFGKRLKTKGLTKKTNPVEVYDSLDRRSETGPLRPSQFNILTNWYQNRFDFQDNVIKLHTGEGKTLIGLLLLQSKINATGQPCLYVCPNKYLAEQVKQDAKKFGIQFVETTGSSDLPEQFLNGEKILITHVQKVFNGLSKFGVGAKSLKIGSIVLDDAHACVDSIRSALTITVGKGNPIYQYFVELFSEDIRAQGEGSFLDIRDGDYDTMLPIPYWCWLDRVEEVTSFLSSHKNDDNIKFSWPLLRNIIKNCQAFISGAKLEISPYMLPIDEFGVFNNADNRIVMSATTQEDSLFIKCLGFCVESLLNSLSNPEMKWSGEKMILMPSLIAEELNRETVVNALAKKIIGRRHGIVFLTPSFSTEEQYHQLGSIVAKKDTIGKNIESLKNGHYDQPVVFVNRYDGIDLPDDSCRILVFDSKPYFDTLIDRYEEECRPTSDILNLKLAQKIEQGLGRSVRGEKDYSVIILLGSDLVKYVKSPVTQKYFSLQTRKQIQIGLDIVDMISEESSHSKSINLLNNVIDQAINRDEGWKDYYVENMSSLEPESTNDNLYELVKLEHDAEMNFFNGIYDKAVTKMQLLCDKFSGNPQEKAWFQQHLARYKYLNSRAESIQLQRTAYLSNKRLLKPNLVIPYEKLSYMNSSRVLRVKNWVAKYNDYEELILSVNQILDDLSFGVKANKFEMALNSVGEMLGYVCAMPDKDIKKGPDNLWCGVNNKYIMFECKNEVLTTRKEINKHEAAQMNSHCEWFKSEYGENTLCEKYIVIPTSQLSYHGNLPSDVKVVNNIRLSRFKGSVKAFFQEFSEYDITQVTDSNIQTWLNTHTLSEKDIMGAHSAVIKHMNN